MMIGSKHNNYDALASCVVMWTWNLKGKFVVNKALLLWTIMVCMGGYANLKFDYKFATRLGF